MAFFTQSSEGILNQDVQFSVSVTESTSIPHQHKDIRVGILGRGYNVLTGTVRGQLFDEISAHFTHDDERRTHTNTYYKDFYEYEREMAKRIGITEFEEGMFSLLFDSNKHSPFLCSIEKVEGTHYISEEIKDELYHLDLDMKEFVPRFNKDHQETAFTTMPFNSLSKKNYYQFLDKYGTHYIKRVNFGAKAEVWWSYEDQFFDVLDKVQKVKRYQKKFKESIEAWTAESYGGEEVKNNRLPGQITESRSKTGNFTLELSKNASTAELIGFRVEEISTLFSDKTIRTELEIAIKVYLDEMKPVRDINRINDNAVVGLFNPDTKNWVRADASGHLWISSSPKISSDCSFEIKKKGNRFGLKSILYGKKLISRGMTNPNFNFHRFQFIGPHESFQIYGDYLQICGNLSAPTFLTAMESKEISHEGNARKKTRLIALLLEQRLADLEQSKELQEILEAVYDEDVTVDVMEDREPIKLTPSGHESGVHEHHHHSGPSPIYKANSTSSLFIKETIHLPNVDELTRRMAGKILAMIRDVSAYENKDRPDVFNEQQHPLTTQKTTFHKLSLETIYHFLNTIFKVEKLAAETSVMSLIYLQRVLRRTNSNLTVYNWRRLSLACLMLAAKVFEDLAVWNVDFVELFPGVGVQDLNRLEKHLLQFLEFNVSFSRQEYVQEYFDLYQHATERHQGNCDHEGKPLDQEALKNLEVRSAASEKIHMTKVNKSVSINVPPSQETKKEDKYPRGILS